MSSLEKFLREQAALAVGPYDDRPPIFYLWVQLLLQYDEFGCRSLQFERDDEGWRTTSTRLESSLSFDEDTMWKFIQYAAADGLKIESLAPGSIRISWPSLYMYDGVYL